MTAVGRHRFEALDAWRGVAALAIAYRHINGTAPFLDNAFHNHLSAAVDFFFVLSGFVIAASYGDRLAHGFSVARFMLLRWGRIWPLHATMVLAYVALELLLLAAGPGLGLAGRAAFTGPHEFATLPGTLFLLQAWLWPGRDLWNPQSWSVSVELGLYLGFGLLWRFAGHRALVIGAALALGLGLVHLAAPAVMLLSHDVLRGVVGFGLGMGCWALWPRLSAIPLGRAATSALEAALVVLAVAIIPLGLPPLALDLVFAAMVLVFARERGLVSSVLLTAPLRWLGVLSYSLYMVHMFVFGRICDALAFVQPLFGARWVDARLGGFDRLLLPAGQAIAMSMAMLAIALACAWAAWRYIEWPARNFSRRLAAAPGASLTA